MKAPNRVPSLPLSSFPHAARTRLRCASKQLDDRMNKQRKKDIGERAPENADWPAQQPAAAKCCRATAIQKIAVPRISTRFTLAIGSEHVSVRPHGLDEDGVGGIGLDLDPKATDGGGNGGTCTERRTPEARHQRPGVQYLPRPSDERGEKIAFQRRQGDPTAENYGVATVGIEQDLGVEARAHGLVCGSDSTAGDCPTWATISSSGTAPCRTRSAP